MITTCYTYTTRLPNHLDAATVVFVAPNVGERILELAGVCSVRVRDGLVGVGTVRITSVRGLVDINCSGARLPSNGVSLDYGSCVTARNASNTFVSLSSFLGACALTGATLRLVNCNFSDGLYEEVLANDRANLVRRANQTVSFGGETLPRTDLIARNTGGANVYRTHITVPARKKYVGFGLVSAPTGVATPIALAGNSVMVANFAGCWLFAEASNGLVNIALHGRADNNNTWVLANFKEWDDGEIPCFAVQYSDETSSNIWRVLGLPTASGAPLRFALRAARIAFKAFRARNQTNKDVKIYESDTLVATISPSSDFGWFGYSSLSDTTTFVVEGSGAFDIDMNTWGRNYYPNYARVLQMCGSLPAVVGVEPDFSALPNEAYNIYLNGALAEMVSTHNKLLYVARMLRNEGVEIRARLDRNFCVPDIILRAVQDAIGALNTARVYLDYNTNTCYVNIYCATSEDEAVIVARVAALLRNFYELFNALYPPGESAPQMQIKVYHREAVA